MQGHLSKMRAQLAEQVQYQLPVGDQVIDLNPYIGKQITLTHTGNINCCNCGKKTKKSYSQGFCYPCMQKLAQCDMCIMKPETCHYDKGTCREPQWGESHCMVPHYVYLSNTSGLKVGITRATQIPTRWIDQGATQGLTIIKVKSRLISGLVEVALGEYINDKTNWRAMLKGNNQDMDLKAIAAELLPKIEQTLSHLKLTHGEDAYEVLDSDIQTIDYPVLQWPTKIASHNFDKNPEVTGTLLGIKGQYLIFDTGVINIRKFGSYEITVSEPEASLI
ncbi:DUF2797 domain-containing protein [Paraferrimonas sp. SM1919]|uniref:DUF2797 domain-containing protein n=1 Tax=Paraferrimonas sp. SM1919 TaxID=2662263 RepID=UPI0013D60213|nr:DUF2797 domain-containing protein [Paraferrimonas sp. SM1919]